jgi:hypothetical protein
MAYGKIASQPATASRHIIAGNKQRGVAWRNSSSALRARSYRKKNSKKSAARHHHQRIKRKKISKWRNLSGGMKMKKLKMAKKP